MSDSTMVKIDLFFEDPAICHNPPRLYSVLYLLRRDISYCIGSDPSSGKALFPAAMAILAGIDLMAKFFKGSDRRGEVGQRFRDFVKKYFRPISSTDADTIYQLRNALLHSFGLYSKSGSRVYNFALAQVQGSLVQPLGNDKYLVDVRTLHNGFEIAIAKYQTDLMADETLQARFREMYPTYGTVYISRSKQGDILEPMMGNVPSTNGSSLARKVAREVIDFPTKTDLTAGSTIADGFPYDVNDASECD
jgi:hypothetical protein